MNRFLKFELTVPLLFEKYVDFIDQYADVDEKVRDELFQKLTENKETVMIAEYIKDIGRKEGIEKGIEKGKMLTAQEAILEAIEVRFGSVPNQLREKITAITNLSVLKSFFKQSILASSLEDFSEMINQSRMMDAQS